MPFLGTNEEELRVAAEGLNARQSGPFAESPRPSSFFSAQNGVHDLINLYLKGLIAAELDDTPAALQAAERLETSRGTAGDRALAFQLAVGVRAQAALGNEDHSEALGLLSGLEIEGWYALTIVSPYYAGALERFTLAELLMAAGREEEALAWYKGLRENTLAELVFSGPGLLREAGIHRRAGEEQQARLLEARFEALWEAADPGVREAVLDQYGG